MISESEEAVPEGSNSELVSPTLHYNRHRERSDKLDEYLDIKIDEELNKVARETPPKDETKTQIVMHIEDYEDKTDKNEKIDDSNDI